MLIIYFNGSVQLEFKFAIKLSLILTDLKGRKLDLQNLRTIWMAFNYDKWK